MSSDPFRLSLFAFELTRAHNNGRVIVVLKVAPNFQDPVMAGPPFLHENIHIHEEHDGHHHRGPAPLLPVIPDLRFEYSYLRSIQPYVQVERVSIGGGGQKDKSTDTLVDPDQAVTQDEGFETLDNLTEKESEEGKDILKKPSDQGRPGPSEIIRIQWKKVVWVTVRDQVISPLLQGALWAIAGYHVKPLFTKAGSRMGTFVYGYLPTKEGLGISWLRRWAKSIGLSRSNNNHNALRPSK